MLKSRHDLETKLLFQFNNIQTEQLVTLCSQLEDEHNYPRELTSDLIAGRKPLVDVNDLVLFWLTEKISPRDINKYFTEVEIKNYSTAKYHVEKLEFPIRFSMLQISDDQWIGSIDVKFLMMLRNAQKIHYNAQTQRALRMLVKGESVIYEPYVNQRAVQEITDLIKENNFIPNTITLNLNEEETGWYYNAEDKEFVIESLGAFDILDGFHRFLAFGNVYDGDDSFNMKMELRITAFTVSRAKQFIHQEDQKTKMKKVDSDSYDQSNVVNRILERVNQSSDCNLYHEINNSGGLVRIGYAAKGLKDIYKKQKLTTRDIIMESKKLVERLNMFTEEHSEYLSKPWDQVDTIMIFWSLGYGTDEEPLIILDSIRRNDGLLKRLLAYAFGTKASLDTIVKEWR
jgi:hypothetical protein